MYDHNNHADQTSGHTRSGLSAWCLHMVTLIVLWGVSECIWINILTYDPGGENFKWSCCYGEKRMEADYIWDHWLQGEHLEWSSCLEKWITHFWVGEYKEIFRASENADFMNVFHWTFTWSDRTSYFRQQMCMWMTTAFDVQSNLFLRPPVLRDHPFNSSKVYLSL